MINRFINKVSCLTIKLKYRNIITFSKCALRKLKVQNRGNGNVIKIAEHCTLKNCNFLFQGSNNTINIGESVKLCGVSFWIEDDNNIISIGKNSTFECGTQLAACEGTNILIGDDCMFSNHISIRTTDSHSIIDNNCVRINEAKDILIGNHVWVGWQSLILKGSVISDNSIVGARSIVSSSSPHIPNSIMAGHPVKIIRRDINWKRERI